MKTRRKPDGVKLSGVPKASEAPAETKAAVHPAKAEKPLTQKQAYRQYRKLGELVWKNEKERFRLMMDYELWKIDKITPQRMFQRDFDRTQQTYRRWCKDFGYPLDKVKARAGRKGAKAKHKKKRSKDSCQQNVDTMDLTSWLDQALPTMAAIAENGDLLDEFNGAQAECVIRQLNEMIGYATDMRQRLGSTVRSAAA